jgi:hypothetical protein
VSSIEGAATVTWRRRTTGRLEGGLQGREQDERVLTLDVGLAEVSAPPGGELEHAPDPRRDVRAGRSGGRTSPPARAMLMSACR